MGFGLLVDALLARLGAPIQRASAAAASMKNVRCAVMTVGDVAEVRIGALTRYGAVSQDGKGEVSEGLVLSLRGANARQVVADLKGKIKEIQPALPPGVPPQP